MDGSAGYIRCSGVLVFRPMSTHAHTNSVEQGLSIDLPGAAPDAEQSSLDSSPLTNAAASDENACPVLAQTDASNVAASWSQLPVEATNQARDNALWRRDAGDGSRRNDEAGRAEILSRDGARAEENKPGVAQSASFSAVRVPSALRHRDFRLFWMGNLVSLVGTMAQQSAQGWLVRDMTPDPFLITLVAGCGTAPILVLTLYAGLLADRVDKRRALMLTNGLAALIAFALAILVWTGFARVRYIALLALGAGIVNAFDIPVRQSFNVEMVGREDLPNAIALNSSAFNGARVAGPAVGGFLLHVVGTAGCFLVNALSFGALMLGLTSMRDIAPHSNQKREPARWQDILDGFRFVRRHEVLWIVTLLVGGISLFAISFGGLLPVFARDVFHTDERGYSVLMTCNGLGALGSAVHLALAGTMRHKGKRLLLGALGFCLSVFTFSCSSGLAVACVCLIFAGWFLLTFLMTANTMVQTGAPDALRGRVFSIYSLALIGTSPIGLVLIGALAKAWGPRHAVQAGAAAGALITVGVFVCCHRLWKEK